MRTTIIRRRLSCICLLIFTGHSQALTITLGFDTLPSAQGWTYEAVGVHHGEPETIHFSTIGSVLSQNTLGSASTGSGHATYTQTGIIDPINPISFSWRSRTLEYEGAGNFGFAFGVATGFEQYLVGFRTNQITFENLSALAWDSTAFHDYRIDAIPGSATFDFFINETKVASPPAIARSLNRIAFGDGTGSANASAEITFLSFTQVPEPGTAALLASGLLAMLPLRRRRASTY